MHRSRLTIDRGKADPDRWPYTLALLSIMIEMLETGSQLIVATHSPLLAALPGADLLQLAADGMHPVATYDDTDLVTSWRAFLRAPEAYLRHLR